MAKGRAPNDLIALPKTNDGIVFTRRGLWMTPKVLTAIDKRETMRGALHPIRQMHAAAQLIWANNDCEEKCDPDERQ